MSFLNGYMNLSESASRRSIVRYAEGGRVQLNTSGGRERGGNVMSREGGTEEPNPRERHRNVAIGVSRARLSEKHVV